MRLVEAVNLVDEEHRALVPELGVGAGLFDLGADLRDVGLHSVESLEAGSGRVGHHPGEGGFPGAGWAVEDERGEAIRLDGAAEEFALAEDVLLAGNLGEREGTHAGSQRFVCAR